MTDLIELENRAFATDHISRRAFRRLLASPQAETIVVEHDGRLAGYALVLFRSGSAVARLYSIAVAPRTAPDAGSAPALLAAAEAAALDRGCVALRLEVHEGNAAAIARYRKSGYTEFGRHRAYYEDKRRRAALREAAHASARRPQRARRPIFTRPPSSPAGRLA